MKKSFTAFAVAFICISAFSINAAGQTVSGYYAVGCTAYAQEETQWCWAAACRMVDWTYSSTTPPAQCTIVNKANSACSSGSCCSNLASGRPSACTSPSYSNKPNHISGCNGSLEWLVDYYASVSFYTGSPLSYTTVESNLAGNKMMVALWSKSSGGGHFVVIYACYMLNYTPNVSYANPSSGSKVTETYAYFKSNSSRTWIQTLSMSYATAYHPRIGEADVLVNNNAMLLYPNPADGVVYLRRSGYITAHAEIYIRNALGQIIYETAMEADVETATLDLAGKLSDGLYIVELVENGVRSTGKLVMQ